MMEVIWILAAILSLLNEGICTYTDERYFNLGSDATLSCSNLTWNETMFVTWKIKLKMQHRECLLALNNNGNPVDKCGDGKSLRNTSTGQLYLHIPNLSINDVGTYECENVFKGGIETHIIKVDIRAPPSLSGWLESEKTVAVCRAERGIPAANISWSQAGRIVETQQEHGGFFTVESRLELVEGADIENLTCSIDHAYWTKDHIFLPRIYKGRIPWITVISVVSVVVLLGGVLFYVQKKRPLRYCRQSHSAQSKSAPMEEVEEVEPYASYVQRVNSLYN